MMNAARLQSWFLGILSFVVAGSAATFGLTYGFASYFWETPNTMFETISLRPWRHVNPGQYQLANGSAFTHAQFQLSHYGQVHPELIPMVQYLQGKVYLEQGRFSNAIAAFEKTIESTESGWFNPVLYRVYKEKAYGQLALLYYLNGNHDKAIDNLLAFDQLEDQEEPELIMALGDSLMEPKNARYHYDLAKALHKNLWVEAARRELTLAQQTTRDPKLKMDTELYLTYRLPKADVKISPMLRYYSLAGDYHMEHQDYTRAIGFYEKAIDLEPQLAWSYHHLSLVYSKLNQKEKTAMYAQQALAIDPQFLLPHITLGDMALESGSYEEAVGHFSKALALEAQLGSEDSGDLLANVENQLGFAYEQMGKFSSAKNHYNMALSWIGDQHPQDDSNAQYAAEALNRINQRLANAAL